MRKSTVSALKNFSFGYFIHSLVIEFSPFVVESVFDKGVVVTARGISIMHTDSLKVIWILVKTSIGSLCLLLELL